MKKLVLSFILCSLSFSHAVAQKGYPITPVPFTSVKVTPGTFWGQRLEASRNTTIPLAFSKCESEGRYKNFENAATHMADPSKVFKVNGVGYSFDDTAGLVMAKVRGGILWGILITTIIGLFIKDSTTGQAITQFAHTEGGSLKLVSLPDSISPIFCKFEWSQILSWDMLAVVFTFLFVDMFDTMGTIIGVHQGAGLIKKGGDEIPGVEKMFFADSIATVCGACFGTSTTTTYVESASGVGEGGRTGLTALTTAILFAVALLLSPLFLAIPSAATAPALIIVGVMMMPAVKNIHWDDYCKAIPAFITLIMMPLAYSISDGILLGVISYVLCHAVAGKFKDISITMWILAVLFVLKYIFI